MEKGEAAATSAVLSLHAYFTSVLSRRRDQRHTTTLQQLVRDSSYRSTLNGMIALSLGKVPRAVAPLISELLSWLPPGWSGPSGIGCGSSRHCLSAFHLRI